ncbi:MAG: DegT/DnrJ/EryC1/StrS family aminotransferase [Planctomycetaceae bacterium]
MSAKIPFLPLDQINAPFREDVDLAFRAILNRGWYLLGEELQGFEKEWAAYCGVDFCVGVGSGLDALQLILEGWKATGRLHAGDEVLVPAHTFFASFLAVSRAGLIPVPVDIRSALGLLNPSDLEAAISEKTRVIMPVHLYGFICPMQEILSFAEKHNLLVLEDAAQSHGARDATGKTAGAFGHAAAFSFYPGKNLGCFGDGGAIVTYDSDLADVVRMLRNYGMAKRYHHQLAGFNSRLDEFQAAVLRIKLRHLDSIRKRRAGLAEVYLQTLPHHLVTLPENPNDQSPAWHLFVIQSTCRDQILHRLSSEFQIEASIHYPVLPADQPGCLAVRRRDCPVAERFAKECLSLPLHECLTEKEVSRIAESVHKCLKKD